MDLPQVPIPPAASSQLDRFNLNIAGITFQAWQVFAVIFLIFLLIVVMASVRRHFMEFTFKGAGMGLALGFILALVIEGILLVGGTTVLTSTLGWRNAPKPISNGISSVRGEFIKVLGATDANEPCVIEDINNE